MDLETIATKLQKIEDKDNNYVENAKWKKLRKLQKSAYVQLAIFKIKEINNILLREKDTQKKQKLIANRKEFEKFLLMEH